MKKLLSILIVMVIAFTGMMSAFAIDEIEIEDSDVIESVKGDSFKGFDKNLGLSYDILVLTFDSKYVQTGEKIQVYLDTYNNYELDRLVRSFPIAEISVSAEVYEYEGVRYPQLFVTIPSHFEFKDSRTVVRVEPGAFISESGEESCKAEILYTSCVGSTPSQKVKLECKGDAVTDRESVIRIIQGSNVSAAVTFEGEYADVWMNSGKIDFYYMGEPAESADNSITAGKEGNYRVEFKLNDQICISKEFIAVQKVDRYFEMLGDRTVALLLSPFALIVSLGLMLFVPGFGTWIGSTTLLASIYSVPGFFSALFGISLSGEYNF